MPFQLYDYEGVVIFVMVGILLIMVIVLIIGRVEGVLTKRVILSHVKLFLTQLIIHHQLMNDI